MISEILGSSMVSAATCVALAARRLGSPSHMFEVSARPDYEIVERMVDLIGLKLDPQRTTTLRLALTAKSKGTFTLRPQVIVKDNLGRSSRYQPEPVVITVKELGVTGWLKGPKDRNSDTGLQT